MVEQLGYNPEREESGEMEEEEFIQEVQAAAERHNIPQESMADLLRKIAEQSSGSETWQTREQDK
jgi:hypothetical protein